MKNTFISFAFLFASAVAFALGDIAAAKSAANDISSALGQGSLADGGSFPIDGMLTFASDRSIGTLVKQYASSGNRLGFRKSLWIQLFGRSEIHGAVDHGQGIGSKQSTVVLLPV
jgi:hypothetical protein